MRYDSRTATIDPGGVSVTHVLIALAMAAYDLSTPLDDDDCLELFPSKGFLFPSEVEPYISIKPTGLQIVMDIAFNRLVMLDVRGERYYDRENGRDGILVLSKKKFGSDLRIGRTPETLIERANTILPDVQNGFARLAEEVTRIFR